MSWQYTYIKYNHMFGNTYEDTRLLLAFLQRIGRLKPIYVPFTYSLPSEAYFQLAQGPLKLAVFTDEAAYTQRMNDLSNQDYLAILVTVLNTVQRHRLDDLRALGVTIFGTPIEASEVGSYLERITRASGIIEKLGVLTVQTDTMPTLGLFSLLNEDLTPAGTLILSKVAADRVRQHDYPGKKSERSSPTLLLLSDREWAEIVAQYSDNWPNNWLAVSWDGRRYPADGQSPLLNG